MAANKTLSGMVGVALSWLLVICAAAHLPAQATTPSSGLLITILDGEGALNDIRKGTAREPIVQVEDDNHRPVAGAAVLFTTPSSGPSAIFPGGAHVLSTVSDSTGRAVAQGLRPNNVSGSYDIQVQANYNGSTAQVTIHQKNVSSQSSVQQHAAHAISLKAALIVVGAAAAAGTVAAVLVLNGGSNAGVITAGSPTVGAPASVPGIRIQLRHHNP